MRDAASDLDEIMARSEEMRKMHVRPQWLSALYTMV